MYKDIIQRYMYGQTQQNTHIPQELHMYEDQQNTMHTKDSIVSVVDFFY
jgi:hypothetical protein